MIVIVTCLDEKGRVVVSHGVDEFMRKIILPCESLEYFKRYCGARYSASIGEWVISENFESECG